MYKIVVILAVLAVAAWVLAKVMFFLVAVGVVAVAWALWTALGARGRRP